VFATLVSMVCQRVGGLYRVQPTGGCVTGPAHRHDRFATVRKGEFPPTGSLIILRVQ
jgi:hypothetical protein